MGWNYDAAEIAGAAVERIHHSGAVPGAFTRVEVLPAKGLAVVLLVPEYGEPGSTAVAESASTLAADVLGDAAAGGGADAGNGSDAGGGAATDGGSGSVLYSALVVALPAATGLDLTALFRWAPDLASGAVAAAALLGIAALIGGIRVRGGVDGARPAAA
ncbi:MULTISPECIES: hypothetical protein [Brevibacterium]|uniref:Uncharacterized protein n=1 Tax=Brevibacterium pityocampae TaxID=506594 RepID=A0ABP8J3R6_9MICO|nr:hypothetical protein [Brevibacterium sp. CS2]QCP04890.1 hypothetical protein FDF13_05920 [Brevibacterium sp. CS2]